MLPPPPPLDWEEPAFFSLASSSLGGRNRQKTTLNGGEVRLICWRITLSDRRLNELLPLLSAEEKARANRFTKKRLTASFVAARTGLRVWLAQFLDCLPEEIEFDYGPKGKPTLAQNFLELTRSKLDIVPHFNLAHSGELALLAISKEPIGVDIERHRPLRSASGMAQRWYSAREQLRITKHAEADQLAEFFHIWSLKESILKFVGSGVGESLPMLETPSDLTGGITAAPPNNQLGLKNCWAQPIEVAEGYSAAITTMQKPTRVDWLSV